jgi:endogenous inhibitor of DNA gyrase (YacG/DUF329 family)
MKLCPNCKKKLIHIQLENNAPFCSERCRLIDLGAWLSEKHKFIEEEPSSETLDELTDFTKH